MRDHPIQIRIRVHASTSIDGVDSMTIIANPSAASKPAQNSLSFSSSWLTIFSIIAFNVLDASFILQVRLSHYRVIQQSALPYGAYTLSDDTLTKMRAGALKFVRACVLHVPHALMDNHHRDGGTFSDHTPAYKAPRCQRHTVLIPYPS